MNLKSVYVEMNKLDFIQGEPCSKFGCAFSLALDRYLKDGFAAGVTKNVIYFQKTGKHPESKNFPENTVTSIVTPGKVRKFIRKYDDNDPEDTFELPLRIRIRIPEEILA